MTDKERLEEAKLMAEMLRVETRLPHDFPFDLVDWLVEQAGRVQELETTVDFYQSALRDADRRVQELESRIADDEHFVVEILEQNKRYREALEEIRNYGTYELNNALKTGYAWIAHEALEEDNEPLRAEVSE